MTEIFIEKCREDARLPAYAHDGDAGMDLYAAEEVIIEPGKSALVPVGIKLAIPYGYEVQIRRFSEDSFEDSECSRHYRLRLQRRSKCYRLQRFVHGRRRR